MEAIPGGSLEWKSLFKNNALQSMLLPMNIKSYLDGWIQDRFDHVGSLLCRTLVQEYDLVKELSLIQSVYFTLNMDLYQELKEAKDVYGLNQIIRQVYPQFYYTNECRLTLKLQWPIHLFIDDGHLSCYREIMEFLCQLRQVAECICIQMFPSTEDCGFGTCQRNAEDPKAKAFRMELFSFFNGILTYFLYSVSC